MVMRKVVEQRKSSRIFVSFGKAHTFLAAVLLEATYDGEGTTPLLGPRTV